MGHKKRNVPPRSKPSPAGAPPSAVGEGGSVVPHGVLSTIETTERNFDPNNSSIEPHKRPNQSKQTKTLVDSESYSEIKAECQKALTVSRRGSHNKALRIMKDLRNKYESSVYSAVVHRVEGTVWAKYAAVIDDANTKQRHLKSAIESARKAVLLSPNSVEFAHFYANLLYEAANDAREYDEVLHECERALNIEDPVDPGKENFLDESELKLSTPDARIGNVHNDLRGLIQKANIASIQTWMKNLGTVDEKFRFIPIRRVSEDPMEVKLVQARRPPNEIKKATKTPEERRKEIEVRVAAARLLQQNSSSPQLPKDDTKSSGSPQLQKDDNKSSSSLSGSSQRGSERRKSGNMRKSSFSAEKRGLVLSYWNSMTSSMKKDLLRIRIPELKSHFSSRKDNWAISVFLTEAISFAEINKTWKFWLCCRCGEKFPDPGSHLQHLEQEHMGNLSFKLQPMIPQKLDTEWVDMLLNCSWKPIDVKAAVTMLENHSKPQVPEHLLEPCSLNKTEEYKDCLTEPYCFEDAWDSPSHTVDEERCNLETADLNGYNYGSDITSRECGENHGGKLFLTNRWPLSGDTECEKLLDKIRANFEVLIKNKCLAASHVDKVIQYAVDELQGLASGSQLISHGVERTPVCICFLGASELKKLLKYLQDLSQSCGINRYSERNSFTSDSINATEGGETKARLILSEDASTLVLDKHFLSSNLNVFSDSCPPPSDARFEYSFLLGSHDVVKWISYGPFPGEQLASWKRMTEDKARQGTEIVQMLEKDFYHLQSMYERKCEHLSYDEALLAVEDLCLEEGKRREHGTGLVHQSYDAFLRKRREELIEGDSNVLFIRSRFELDAITNVLKEAETLNINQFGFETYGLSNHLTDLESGEDDDWRIKDYLQHVDSCIEVAIQRQKEQVVAEIGKLDAKMMRCLSGMEQMEAKLTSVSALDYQPTLVSILRAFLKASLEELAEKDATEKSDAAREAFLAELALDKKGIVGGNDDSKYGHEKLRDKRKHREQKKAKDLKDTGNNEAMLHHETTDADSFPVVPDEDVSENCNFAPESCDDSVKQEEERRRIELEEEERKLEETLEYQRRVEDEAKQKHLAEQHKKMTRTIPEKHGNIDQIHKQNYCKQEPLTQKNGYPNVVESMRLNTVAKLNNTQGHQPMEVKEVLHNGRIPEDVILSTHCDQWVGRRGRRQKSSAKVLGGKYQNVSAEKENINTGEIGTKNSLLGNSDSHQVEENETKTLRQLQAEDDDERFKADLERAVRQSLDTFHARQNFPLVPSSKMIQKMTPELPVFDLSCKEVELESMNMGNACGTGLKNEVGEYNCFLNVIIQSLWHLRRFRDEFLKRSTADHFHIGDPCVTCALHDIFTALSMASKNLRSEAVAPTSLRIALSNLYPDSNFFQEAQMNDASEVLGVIFDCLHRSFASRTGVSDTESVESNCTGLWDCSNAACIAHTLFGMDIFEKMNCYNCGLESRPLKYTSFFHNINASALRTMKEACAESSFGELLNLVEMNHQLACDTEAGGCGKLNYIHHILSTAPHVFTTVLGWQNTCESVEDIKATLGALATEIDVGVLYRGLDPRNRHHLVSVVCYYGQHYHCFAYSRDRECWVMYDDNTVKVIGGWSDVLTMCERGHLQPQVLFYEAVN